jgi:hypothetical protein
MPDRFLPPAPGAGRPFLGTPCNGKPVIYALGDEWVPYSLARPDRSHRQAAGREGPNMGLGEMFRWTAADTVLTPVLE